MGACYPKKELLNTYLGKEELGKKELSIYYLRKSTYVSNY